MRNDAVKALDDVAQLVELARGMIADPTKRLQDFPGFATLPEADKAQLASGQLATCFFRIRVIAGRMALQIGEESTEVAERSIRAGA